MIGIDTNLLLYAQVSGAPQHNNAREYLQSLASNRDVVICELVLVELYLLLRNPVILEPALSAPEAAAICQGFRKHRHWQIAESADIMEKVWRKAEEEQVARRKIIDLRLAFTLQHHGVTRFATGNVKDFENLGFEKVWNPMEQ